MLALVVAASGYAAGADARKSARRALPKYSGGLVYPTPPGNVSYGEPLARLYQAWGGRPKPCFSPICAWRRGSDTVYPDDAPRSNRSWPRALDGLNFSAVKNGTVPMVKQSRLKRWRTPEGIRIGSTLAAVRSAYGSRLTCGRRFSYCGGYTRPCRVSVNGRPRRQIFLQSFHFTAKQPTVYGISVALDRDEAGATSPSTSRDTTLETSSTA